MKEVQLKSSGTPEFEYIDLITLDGNVISIAQQLYTINIFEDMFSPVLTGNLIINDNINLFDSLPITANEKIRIKFKSWNYADNNLDCNFIHRTFDILSITDIKQINDYTKQYTLHFASPEFKKSELTKISTSYIQSDISEVVKNILVGNFEEDLGLDFPENQLSQKIKRTISQENVECEYQKVDEFDSVEFFAEKTKYTDPIITIPYMKPFDIIKHLCTKALRHKDTKPSANFLFFENKRGFQFVSLDTLYEQAEFKDYLPVLQFGNAAQNKTPDKIKNTDITLDELLNDIKNDRFGRSVRSDTIIKLEIQNCFDIIKNINNGVFASNLMTYDFMTGQIKENHYNYLEEFYEQKSIGKDADKVPFLQLDKDGKNILSEKMNSKRILSPIANRLTDTITNFPSYRNNSLAETIGEEQYIQERLSQLAMLSNFRVIVEIKGNSAYKVGDMINLDLKISDDYTGKQNFNKHYSGLYIISAIKHGVSITDYTMQIELIKNCYDAGILACN